MINKKVILNYEVTKFLKLDYFMTLLLVTFFSIFAVFFLIEHQLQNLRAQFY